MTTQLVSSGAAGSEVGLEAKRIDYVDVSRGVLILLMFIVHAATPCASSIRDPIQRLWILEVATTGFAMMAGYTVGIRYDVGASVPQPIRLWRRSGELLLVMFWSNCILGLGKLYVNGQTELSTLLPWFVGLLTFHTEYNISGVLFPIALLLPSLPVIYSTEKRIGRVGGLVWFAAIVVLFVNLKQHKIEDDVLEHIRTILVVGLGGFSVLGFVAYGILGYANARLLHLLKMRGYSLGAIVSVAGLVSGILLVLVMDLASNRQLTENSGGWEPAILPFVRSEVMFLSVIATGVLLTEWRPIEFMMEPFKLMGAYALLAFVFHRFVGQGLMTLLHLQGGELGTFLLMLGVTAGSTYLLCLIRQSSDVLDAGLKRLFL